MNNLSKDDIHFVVSRLPKDVRELMQKDQVFLGGGFIRATIAGERPSDIDLFGANDGLLDNCANKLVANRPGARKISTKNAITVYQSPRLPVQFITRWVFDDPVRLAESFDFTISQAVIWYNRTPVQMDTRWSSWTAEGFYRDLAARRLVYTRPVRNEDAGGSLMRVRKFLGRGYNIQPPALAAVLARLVSGVDAGRVDVKDEVATSRVLEGLLREVDPLSIIDGEPITDEDVDAAFGSCLSRGSDARAGKAKIPRRIFPEAAAEKGIVDMEVRFACGGCLAAVPLAVLIWNRAFAWLCRRKGERRG